jgi:hypothetical protein
MIEVCDGPACRLRAADLGLGAVGRPVGCLGRCDVPVAAVDGERALTIVARGCIEPYAPPPLPPQPFVPILLRAARTGANAFAACVLRPKEVEPGGEGEHATRLCAVSGDVLRPGVYELLAIATVADAVAAAGGAVDGLLVATVGGYLADGEWGGDLARAIPTALVVLHQRRDRHLLHSAADA